MTTLAIGANADCGMRRIVCTVIIALMAAYTGILYVGIITIMALVTVCRSMCPGQWIIIIVNVKCRWRPARICCMAGRTSSRDTERGMVWVVALVIGSHMTCSTICWCSAPPIGMAT